MSGRHRRWAWSPSPGRSPSPRSRCACCSPSSPPPKGGRDDLRRPHPRRPQAVVAAIVPIYLAVRDIGALDDIGTLIVLYTAMNLPIAVWMLRSFFLEVPREVLEAARVDGATQRQEITRVMLPMVAPGIAATAL